MKGPTMRFDIFQTRADAHLRKAREYLQQANIARIDHQTAAEHHAALAAMYAQRVVWLENELSAAEKGPASPPPRTMLSRPADMLRRGPETIVALARLQRAGVADGV